MRHAPTRRDCRAARKPRRRPIVARNINAAGVNERADVAKLNAGLRQELAGKGLTFNQPDIAAFREKLRSAGFYSERKGKYGDEAWALLEKSLGKLSQRPLHKLTTHKQRTRKPTNAPPTLP